MEHYAVSAKAIAGAMMFIETDSELRWIRSTQQVSGICYLAGRIRLPYMGMPQNSNSERKLDVVTHWLIFIILFCQPKGFPARESSASSVICSSLPFICTLLWPVSL